MDFLNAVFILVVLKPVWCSEICFNAFTQNKWIIFGSDHLCCSKIEKKEGQIWNWNSTIPSCITLKGFFFFFWPSCQTVLPATEWSDGLQSLKTPARAFKCADYSSLSLSFLLSLIPLICDICTYTRVVRHAVKLLSICRGKH